MDAEILSTLCFEELEALYYLVVCKAVLGITGVVHYLIGYLEFSARIVAAADSFRNTAKLVKMLNVSKIINVDISTELPCLEVVLIGGHVGRKHYIASAKAAALAEHKLCER